MIDTDRTDNLLKKTAGGAGWTITWRAATRALGFLSTLVLARILVPADFGLVALAISFSRAIDVFGEIGAREALIRLTDAHKEDYDAAFTVNAIRGVVTTILVVASAGLFAQLFGDPRLYVVVMLLSVTVLLDAFENIGVADFRRDLDFHLEFQLFIFPRLAQVVITITLAIVFANYWALVVGIITSRALQTIASYLMHPYRPTLSLRGWRNIVGFSVWTWLLSMARMIKERCVLMVVGGTLNTAALGVYAVGSEIATLPETELISPLTRACFAGFSAARRAGLSVSETYLRIVASTSLIVMPASIGISSVAGPLVYVAFGDRWSEAVPVVEIFAIAGAFAVVGRIGMSLFNAFAYLGSLFWCAVFGSILQLVLLIPLVRYSGIVGAAYAWAIATLIEYTVVSVLAFQRFHMRPWDLLARLWRSLLASAAMTAFLVLSGLGWAASAATFGANLRQLFIASLCGTAAYTICLLGLWLISGRPIGPETDVLSLLRGATARLYGFVSRRTALLWTAGSR